MDKITSCKYNMDNRRVELKYSDGTIIAIDTYAVENEVNADTWQCSELDWLIYNKPWEYADLVLNGGIEEYIKGTCEHSLLD